jgi:hypothetical protein
MFTDVSEEGTASFFRLKTISFWRQRKELTSSASWIFSPDDGSCTFL